MAALGSRRTRMVAVASMTTPLMLTLAKLWQLASRGKEVMDALTAEQKAALPPDAQRALAEYEHGYTEYAGGFAPADAPHIPNDGRI